MERDRRIKELITKKPSSLAAPSGGRASEVEAQPVERDEMEEGEFIISEPAAAPAEPVVSQDRMALPPSLFGDTGTGKPVKPVMVMLKTDGFTLRFTATMFSVSEHAVGFFMDKRYCSFEPSMSSEYDVSTGYGYAEKYRVLYAGGYLEFKDSNLIFLTFIRVRPQAGVAKTAQEE
jgi:hypothetical protein